MRVYTSQNLRPLPLGGLFFFFLFFYACVSFHFLFFRLFTFGQVERFGRSRHQPNQCFRVYKVDHAALKVAITVQVKEIKERQLWFLTWRKLSSGSVLQWCGLGRRLSIFPGGS